MFEDESHYVLRPIVKRVYTPDKKPVVKQEYQKSQRLSVFGTLEVGTGRMALAAANTVNYFTFLGYLQTLQEEYRSYDELILILDGATYHHLPLSLQSLLWTRPAIKFIYLPPVSPELNPSEQIWKLSKKKIASVYYHDIFDLIYDVLDFGQTFTPSLCQKYNKIFQG